MNKRLLWKPLACLTVLLTVSISSLVADEKDQKKKPAIDKIKLILHRQKGEQLKVYINSHGSYVNGKSVSAKELNTLAKRSKLQQATITFEPYVTKSRVSEIEKLLQGAGIKKTTKQVKKKKKKQQKSTKKKSSKGRKTSK